MIKGKSVTAHCRCTKCGLPADVWPVLMGRMIDGVTLLSLCCNAPVKVVYADD